MEFSVQVIADSRNPQLDGQGGERRRLQAGDTAEALAESLRETADLVTKDDITHLATKAELYRALWLQAAGIVGVLSAVGALLKVLG